MTAIAPVAASPEGRGASPERPRLRRWLHTTPGYLRLLSVAAVMGLAVLWLAGTTALATRREATRSVGLESGPQLTMANDLYSSLAGADATASGALLRKGFEPDAVRQRYLDDLTAADRLLIAIAEQGDQSPKSRRAIRAVATQMSTYAGRVETARAHSRLGNPVSAAYMRQASAQMRDEILPAATTIWEDAAARLQDDYEVGTSDRHITAVSVAGGLAVLVLAGTLVFVARRTNRIVNLGVAAATVLVVVVVGWSLVQMQHEEDALEQARDGGSYPVQLLSAARILALQAQADASLALAERGTGEAYTKEFAAIAEQLVGRNGSGGLLAEARAAAERAGAEDRTDAATAALREYLTVAQVVRERDDAGDYGAAVDLALSEDAGGLAGAAATINARMDDAIAESRARFRDDVAEARRGFDVLLVVLSVAMIVAIACVIGGLQPRIGEYR